jgi:hypothetical protein
LHGRPRIKSGASPRTLSGDRQRGFAAPFLPSLSWRAGLGGFAAGRPIG